MTRKMFNIYMSASDSEMICILNIGSHIAIYVINIICCEH